MQDRGSHIFAFAGCASSVSASHDRNDPRVAGGHAARRTRRGGDGADIFRSTHHGPAGTDEVPGDCEDSSAARSERGPCAGRLSPPDRRSRSRGDRRSFRGVERVRTQTLAHGNASEIDFAVFSRPPHPSCALTLKNAARLERKPIPERSPALRAIFARPTR